MKTILRVTFSCERFSDILIENPAFLPTHGEAFYCIWGDYIDDEEVVKQLEDLEENDYWVVQRVASTYGKDIAECHIVLHEAESFKG
ncbi:hypothetical protein [Carboxylicivirga marina]|uniref:hypothetical protein n=1 Tax=Carboxylicivirga marina TaxID=2800988 RepID=UPI0025961B2A|nr:hypothetical protein [uncultured Carboxylicivirga sp.]